MTHIRAPWHWRKVPEFMDYTCGKQQTSDCSRPIHSIRIHGNLGHFCQDFSGDTRLARLVAGSTTAMPNLATCVRVWFVGYLPVVCRQQSMGNFPRAKVDAQFFHAHYHQDTRTYMPAPFTALRVARFSRQANDKPLEVSSLPGVWMMFEKWSHYPKKGHE